MAALPRRVVRGIRCRMFKSFILIFAVTLMIAGCGGPKARITKGTAQGVETKSRSEPIFYNGKTYRLDYSYSQSVSLFDMKVSGMGPKQRNDAVAVATSSLRYFACPDSQKGQLVGDAAYEDKAWNMQARCG